MTRREIAEIASFGRLKIAAVDDSTASSQTPNGPSPATYTGGKIYDGR
jgi:hypothetical protein